MAAPKVYGWTFAMTDVPPETRDQRYKRQTGEQFELIGRFVQAFELMVDAARYGCLRLTANTPKHQHLLNIVFHHQSFTALPLIHVLRAMIAEIVADTDYKTIDADDRSITTKVLTQIFADYKDVTERRNELLHGTWYIGWANPADEDFSDIGFLKLKAIAKGLVPAKQPDVGELQSLISECQRLAHLLNSLVTCLTWPDGSRVAKNFKKDDNGKWLTTIKRG